MEEAKKQKTVLVCEDDEDICFMISNFFRNYKKNGINFFVETAFNGSNALDMLKENNFDIVLSDLLMPGMNGMDVLRHVRLSNNTNQATPFVLISGYLNEFSCKTIDNSVLKDVYFIEKPFELAKIERIVKIVLASKFS